MSDWRRKFVLVAIFEKELHFLRYIQALRNSSA